jgi:hypothetical protein
MAGEKEVFYLTMQSVSKINVVSMGDLGCFGLFVHPFSHTFNIGHFNYRLQFIYYNTTYNICTSTQYNVLDNNTKFKYQLEVQSVTTSRNMCICINIPRVKNSNEK